MRFISITVLVFCSLCIASCSSLRNDKNSVKDFIPGTYAKEVHNEFLIGHDTLIIQCITGNSFLIVNRTVYQRIQNGKLLPLHCKQGASSALYDEKSEKLTEQRLGKTYVFDPANKRLFEEGSAYRKVAQ